MLTSTSRRSVRRDAADVGLIGSAAAPAGRMAVRDAPSAVDIANILVAEIHPRKEGAPHHAGV
jgi:hypothetical protein